MTKPLATGADARFQQKNLDLLAREICWREFTPPRSVKRIGRTKAQYWAGVSNANREEYLRDARFLMWCMKNLPIQMLASDYVERGPQ